MQVDLPDSVQQIADVIGREKALELIGQLRPMGSRPWRLCLYVPITTDQMTDQHFLVETLGWELTRAMVREFGGEILQPANCNCLYRAFRDREIIRLLDKGFNEAKVASALCVSLRVVQRVARACTTAVHAVGPSRPPRACG